MAIATTAAMVCTYVIRQKISKVGYHQKGDKWNERLLNPFIIWKKFTVITMWQLFWSKFQKKFKFKKSKNLCLNCMMVNSVSTVNNVGLELFKVCY